ncbi:uncharacterized protein [Dermacentor albipictus]|uniref:uncharacterized protein n=1 Tax=Dermacentor albipictus TaxID=60249 RepID=UPI0038FCFF1A
MKGQESKKKYRPKVMMAQAKKNEGVPTLKEGSDAGQPAQSPTTSSRNATKPYSLASPPNQPPKDYVMPKSAVSPPGQTTAGTKMEEPNETPDRKVQSEMTKEQLAGLTAQKIQKDGRRAEDAKYAMADAEWGWRIKSKDGKKYEILKVSGSKSERPSSRKRKSKSTDADLDYGPYFRRYPDSWNPEHEGGYYGAYGEWRPEEECPYYAPYGIEPWAPYFASQPSPSCPIHGHMRRHPAQRSQGNFIPIPISIPMPMPSGSSSGPVIINVPPPPPPPSLPPPPQPERRSTPLQDMTSFMMAMMLKDTMKGSTGDLFPSVESLDQQERDVTATPDDGERHVPSEPAYDQLGFLQQQTPPSSEPSKYTGAIAEGEPAIQDILQKIGANLGKKKRKKKHNAEKDDEKPTEPKEKPARRHKAISKQRADEVMSLGSSESTVGKKSPASSQGDEDEEEDEDQEGGAPETAYGGATCRCVRHCCLLLLVLFLAGVIVANVAYTLSPRRFSNFLCSLGIFKPDNLSNVNLSLIDDGSELGHPLEDSASGRSIFDVRHEVMEEPFYNEAQTTDQIDEYEETAADTSNGSTRCTGPVMCDQTTIQASGMFTSTEDFMRRFLNFEDDAQQADSNDEEDESLKSIDFGSFLDTGGVQKRSTTTPSAPQGNRAPGMLATMDSALKDLLSRFPQPRSDDVTEMQPAREVVFNADDILDTVTTGADRSAVTLGEYRVPSIPVVNTRPRFFEEALKYRGRTNPPAIFHLQRILVEQYRYMRNITDTNSTSIYLSTSIRPN